jgi:hypothetical protein
MKAKALLMTTAYLLALTIFPLPVSALSNFSVYVNGYQVSVPPGATSVNLSGPNGEAVAYPPGPSACMNIMGPNPGSGPPASVVATDDVTDTLLLQNIVIKATSACAVDIAFYGIFSVPPSTASAPIRFTRSIAGATLMRNTAPALSDLVKVDGWIQGYEIGVYDQKKISCLTPPVGCETFSPPSRNLDTPPPPLTGDREMMLEMWVNLNTPGDTFTLTGLNTFQVQTGPVGGGGETTSPKDPDLVSGHDNRGEPGYGVCCKICDKGKKPLKRKPGKR